MKSYNKLVRDKIPDIIKASGAKPLTRIITDEHEYLDALLDKDVEEGKELRDNPCLEELADKQEVLNAIAAAIGYSPSDVERARLRKAEERGGFNHRIFLESVE